MPTCLLRSLCGPRGDEVAEINEGVGLVRAVPRGGAGGGCSGGALFPVGPAGVLEIVFDQRGVVAFELHAGFGAEVVFPHAFYVGLVFEAHDVFDEMGDGFSSKSVGFAQRNPTSNAKPTQDGGDLSRR